MLRAVLLAVVGGLLTGCATSVVRPPDRQPVTASVEPACTPDATGRWQTLLNLRQGALAERECALRIIATGGAGSGTDQFNDVRRGVGLLHGFYNRRAERQQSFIDIGAGITLISAAAAFEGGISASTQQAWGVAAFAPVALAQFNANEPTREMYHGGALALQLITTRYDRLDRALTIVGSAPTAPTCTSIDQLVSDLQRGMASGQPLLREDPAGAIIGEARRLQRECLALKSNHDLLVQAVRYTNDIRSLLAADYADAVLQLDHALLAKDRDLRYTAAETLGAIVASPLRAADSLLTGENAQGALNSLKTQVAFTGLNRSLSRVRLPPLPNRLPQIEAIAPGVDSLDRAGTLPRQAVLSPWLHRLRAESLGLGRTQQQQDFALVMVGEYAAAASSDQLTFAFDVTTSTTTISLGPRPAPADPLVSATTAPGTAALISP